MSRKKPGLLLGLLALTLIVAPAKLSAQEQRAPAPAATSRGQQEVQGADETAEPTPELFSGPQKDEPLPELSALPLLGDSAEPVVVVPSEKEALQLIVFMHQRTRPGFALLRGLATYSKQLGDKIDSSVVFLTDEVGETKQWSVNARQAIPEGARMLVSNDGIEGPGTWGLNRNVTMTVVLGQAGKTVGNFALVQPSAADDLKQISIAIANELKIDPPSQRQLSNWLGQRQMQAGNQPTVDIRPLLAPVIQKTATPEKVEAAAQKVIARAEKDAAFKVAVGDACRRIVSGGVLQNYGTAPAQAYLQTWADTFKSDEKGEAESASKATEPKKEMQTNGADK